MTQGNTGMELDGKGEGSRVNFKVDSLFFENRIAREQIASVVSPQWLTTNEAAQYLRVSANAIKTMVYRGKIRVHKLGRRNRFLRDELERLIVFPVTNRRQ
jgi:excisionase family DNA binding protein